MCVKGVRMGFGLDIKDKPLEFDKTDWVNYKGIMMPKNTARAKKAWVTMREKQEKQSYNRNKKNQVRENIIKIIDENISHYTETLTLETEEFLFAKKLPWQLHFVFENNFNKYKKMLKNKPNNVWLHYDNLEKACRLDNEFEVIYLDFCCTFSKAKKTIGALLEKISTSVYFGFTFCLRKNKKNMNDYKFDFINKIQDLLQEHPRGGFAKNQNKINSKLIYGESYRDGDHAPMITLFFKNISNDVIKKGVKTNSKYDTWTTQKLLDECKKRGLTDIDIRDSPEVMKLMLETNKTVDALWKMINEKKIAEYDAVRVKNLAVR